ncbi:Hint domain-containing protein [Shimia sediminis]|uniref:Hint domain-containing protein n=1 Tax=Shimia sediminis TaxID=2497945 RepID=UPI000F8D7F63|nr:Hint domain-containing protein [Shimia sediminis]
MATWLHLGSAADVDPTEGSYLSENAANLIGTYSNAVLSTVDAVGNDANGDGLISENDVSTNGDTISIDGVALVLDSIQAYSTTITRGDGTTYNTTVGVAQMADGNLYLIPISETDLDFMNIQSVALTSVVNASFNGLYTTSASRSIDNTRVVCFARGTRLVTPKGPVDVADLKRGDMVQTMDNGLQPIRWVDGRRVRAIGKLAPVRIRKDALGMGVPSRDLLVSQQHRILLRSKLAIRHFGTAEILVPAKKLVDLSGIEIVEDLEYIEYFHFLLPHHEIIFAESAPVESMYLGQETLVTVSLEARDEIFTLFPELHQPAYVPRGARLFAPSGSAPGKSLRQFLQKALRNNRSLLEGGPAPAQ